MWLRFCSQETSFYFFKLFFFFFCWQIFVFHETGLLLKCHQSQSVSISTSVVGTFPSNAGVGWGAGFIFVWGDLRSHASGPKNPNHKAEAVFNKEFFFFFKGKKNLKDRLTLSSVPELGVECRYNIALLLCCLEVKGSRLEAFPKFHVSILKLRVQIVSVIFFVAIKTSQRF